MVLTITTAIITTIMTGIMITIMIIITRTITIMRMGTVIPTRTFRRRSRTTRTAPASAIRSGCKDVRSLFSLMVVLGTTIHEFVGGDALLPSQTRGWSDQVRP
jgi:hypothetical protein